MYVREDGGLLTKQGTNYSDQFKLSYGIEKIKYTCKLKLAKTANNTYIS